MPKTKSKKDVAGRTDGRKPLLVYMAPDTIRELKKAALDADRNAYEIVEESVNDWLSSKAKRKRKQ